MSANSETGHQLNAAPKSMRGYCVWRYEELAAAAGAKHGCSSAHGSIAIGMPRVAQVSSCQVQEARSISIVLEAFDTSLT